MNKFHFVTSLAEVVNGYIDNNCPYDFQKEKIRMLIFNEFPQFLNQIDGQVQTELFKSSREELLSLGEHGDYNWLREPNLSDPNCLKGPGYNQNVNSWQNFKNEFVPQGTSTPINAPLQKYEPELYTNMNVLTPTNELKYESNYERSYQSFQQSLNAAKMHEKECFDILNDCYSQWAHKCPYCNK